MKKICISVMSIVSMTCFGLVGGNQTTVQTADQQSVDAYKPRRTPPPLHVVLKVQQQHTRYENATEFGDPTGFGGSTGFGDPTGFGGSTGFGDLTGFVSSTGFGTTPRSRQKSNVLVPSTRLTNPLFPPHPVAKSQQPVRQQGGRGRVHNSSFVLPPAPFNKGDKLGTNKAVARTLDDKVDQSTLRTLSEIESDIFQKSRIHDDYLKVSELSTKYQDSKSKLDAVLVGTVLKIVRSNFVNLRELMAVLDIIGGKWEDICNNSFCITRQHKYIRDRHVYLDSHSLTSDLMAFCELLYSVDNISQITLYDYWNPLINRPPFIVMAQLTNFLLRCDQGRVPLMVREAIFCMWERLVNYHVAQFYFTSALVDNTVPEKLLKTPLFDNSYSYDVLGDRNTLSREQLVIYTLYDDLCSVGEDEIADKRKALYDKLKCYISNKPDCDDCNNEKQLHSANFMSNNTPLDLKNLFQMVVDGNPAKIEAYVTYKDIGDPIYERTVGYKTASEGKFMLAYMIAGVTVFQNDQSYSVFSKHIIDEFMSQENWSQINPQREQRYLFGIYE